MSEVAVRTPMQYLDKAVGALRDVGLMPTKVEPAPINALLERISDLEPEKIQVIARTLGQASAFNEVVREQIAGMEIGERYKDITRGFNSIRDDAKGMVDQLADSKLDMLERVNNVWMKIARGDIAARFNKVNATYLDVTKDTKDQIDREHTILEAYTRLSRGAQAGRGYGPRGAQGSRTAKLEERACRSLGGSEEVANFAGKEPADRARLEIARDEKLAPRAGRGEALPGCQGPLRQSHHLLQHVRGGNGAAETDDQRQGAPLPAVDFVLFDQRDGADGAQGLVHRHVRPPRVDQDARTP